MYQSMNVTDKVAQYSTVVQHLMEPMGGTKVSFLTVPQDSAQLTQLKSGSTFKVPVLRHSI